MVVMMIKAKMLDKATLAFASLACALLIGLCAAAYASAASEPGGEGENSQAGIATAPSGAQDGESTVSSGKVSGPQDTLWKMRWDVQRAASEESVWHQYATGRMWATGIATVMAEFYSSIDLPFEKTGLTFEIPKFS